LTTDWAGLLQAWCAWGLPPGDFWEQNPASYRAIIAGRQQADAHETERGVLIAWMGEAMAREPKRLKSPKYWLAMLKPRKQQTARDVLAIFRNFQSAGVPVRIRKIGSDT